MTISKTKIGNRIHRKMDPMIVNTILAAKKHKEWMHIAQVISSSRRRYSAINLKRLDTLSNDGDIIIIPGTVLGSGVIQKKITVCALHFSDSARKKILSVKGETRAIIDEIGKNPRAQGIKIIE